MNHADLCRITVAMTKLNAAKKLVRRIPSQIEVAHWVDEAKTLPRTVTY